MGTYNITTTTTTTTTSTTTTTTITTTTTTTTNSRKDFKILSPRDRNSAHVECESNSDTSNNRDEWNYFKITQTVPEQHTRKARN